MAKISVVDDGGPVRGRLSVNVAPGLGNGDASAIVVIGELEIRVAGVEELAAERCRAIAAEFRRMALELLGGELELRREIGAVVQGPVGEAERVEEIRNAVRAARLPTAFGDRLIREGVDLDEARRIVFSTLASRAES